MKPFSITAPEEIAKEYGGNKKKIQQAAAQGMISPTEAVLAGMFVDRIRGAAQAEQAQQSTVAEQVMNPQPQMPPQGMAAMPPAQQMPPQAQMGRPAPQPQMPQQPMPQQMAMGGGLDAIPYNEGNYAPGGVVSFNVGGGYGETMQQLRNQLSAARTQMQRDQIQGAMNQLRAQYEQPSLQPNLSTGPAREGLAAVDTSDPMAIGMETFADGMVPQPNSNRFNTGTLTEAEARRIEGGLGATPEARDFGVDAVPLTAAQQEMQDQKLRIADRRANTTSFGDVFSGLGDLIKGRNSRQRGDIGTMTADDAIAALGEDGTRPVDLSMPPPLVSAEQQADMEGTRVTGSTLEDRRGTLAEQVARMRAGADSETMVGDGALRDMGRSPFGLEKQFDREETPSVQEQIEAAAEPKTETKPTPEPEAETELSLSDEFTAFQDKMKGIMPKNEFGEYRKKFEQMMKDTKGTMQKGRKDAFNMALLQAGLGMLGQQGGQTALQALGKAALPATKQYMDTVKGLKKEERELLKLGLSLEQMDAKEKAAATRTMANLFGQERARQATLDAAELRRSADNKFFDEFGAEAYREMMEDRAAAGALARLPAQQQKQNLDVAEFLSDAEETAGKVFDDPLEKGARKKEAEDLGISVQELRKRKIEEARNKALSDLRGPSSSNQGGGTQPPMESKDKNGRPIVSYDGGQNWVYK